MWPVLPHARTATMDIIRIRARLTGTMVLAGSTAASLSVRVRGSAGDMADGADLDSGLALVDAPASGAGPDLVVDLDSVDDPAQVDVVESAGSTVAQFTAAGAASMVEAVDSTVVAAMAAVAIGNFAN
jgi:hypothetical protein